MPAAPSRPPLGAQRRRALVWLLLAVNVVAGANVVWQTQRYTRLNRPPDGMAVVRVTNVQLRENNTVALTYEADLDSWEMIEANDCHFLAATGTAEYRSGVRSTVPGALSREAVWCLPPPYTRDDAANAVQFLRQHWLGRQVTLPDTQLKMLFEVRNDSGDFFQGFLRLVVARPPSASPPAGGVVLSAPARGLRVSSGGRKIFGLHFVAGEESLLTCEFILRRGDRSVCLPGLSAHMAVPGDGAYQGCLMWFAPPATGNQTATWELRAYDDESNRDSQAGRVTLPDMEHFDWQHESPLAPVKLVANEVRDLPLFRAATEAGPDLEVFVRVRRAPLPGEFRNRHPHGALLNGLPAGHVTPTTHPPAEQRKEKGAPVKGREHATPVQLAASH